MAFPKIDGYVVTEKLGSGSYSTVYKAYTKVGARSVVAVKCVDKSRLKHSHSAVDNLMTEIRLLKTLSHPHIVQMKEFTWDDRNIYIITEYCCGGDLSRYIQRYGRVPERQVLYFLQQLASALKFLREKGVVHMDLKPHNLLLHKDSNGKYTLKVADFGFAQYMSADSSQSGVRGSPLYMAPEMFREGASYGPSVDLWSLGVIMYECLFGRAPYSSSTFKELMQKINNKAPIQVPQQPAVSAGCRSLLVSLLQHSPSERISYEQFFAHPYLDLEHMPSEQNYQKAVSLIKQAIEYDTSRRLEEALDAYCAGLRYLVPELGRHSAAGTQAVLRDKITRYMERAEEIKAILKRPSQSLPASPFPVAAGPTTSRGPGRGAGRGGTCCVGGGSSSGEYGTQIADTNTQPLCPCIATEGSSVTERSEHSRHTREQNTSLQNYYSGTDISAQYCDDEPYTHERDPISTGNAEQKRRFELSRWFKKKSATEVPYLTDNDIKEDSSTDRDKLPVGEAANEMCKIT